VPLHIIDTAGLRETSDEVERHGIARTWRALENAHVALLLIDAAHGITEIEKSILTRLRPDLPKLWIHNKIDLTNEAPVCIERSGDKHLHLSAKSGEGVELLQQELLHIAGYRPGGEGVFMARARHLEALQAVQEGLDRSRDLLGQPELLAEELRLAQEALNTITGEFTPDDLLGEIFSRFCIGK
jgi:tRNA modification GTPase